MRRSALGIFEGGFRSALANEMLDAAELRGTRLPALEDELGREGSDIASLAMSSHGEGCIAITRSSDAPSGVSDIFAYVDFRTASCSNALSSDFYDVKITENESNESRHVANWVNSKGQSVLTVPATIEDVVPVPNPNIAGLEVSYTHDPAFSLGTSAAVSRIIVVQAWTPVPPAGHKKTTVVVA